MVSLAMRWDSFLWQRPDPRLDTEVTTLVNGWVPQEGRQMLTSRISANQVMVASARRNQRQLTVHLRSRPLATEHPQVRLALKAG